MNWFLIGFPLSLIAANIVLYKLHHKEIGLSSATDRPTYVLSLPTRLFAQAKYIMYFACAAHVIANPLWLNPGSPGPLRLIAGILTGILSLLLLAASLRALGANYAPCHSGVLPKELVKNGPYRFCSHPIYLSNVLLYLSFALLSFGYLIVALLLTLCCMYYFAIRDENRALHAHFTKA
jgi:protein-S-isoprenylcysteine O-methyltransferase Ste14